MKNKLSISAMMLFGAIVTSKVVATTYSTSIEQPTSITTPSICVVSVNVDNKNIVVWSKPADDYIDHFNVYRESTQQTGKWENIGKTMYTSPIGVFTDTTAEPLKQSYKYRLSSVDKCGNETDMCSLHKTITLTFLKNTNNSYSLFWNEYEGFDISSYNIYRGTTKDNFMKIASTAAGNYSFNDTYTVDGPVYYQIEVVSPTECAGTQLKSTNATLSSRSNIVSNVTTGTKQLVYRNEIKISPNPVNNISTISFPNETNVPFQLSIYSTTGNKMKEQTITTNKFEFSKDGLAEGIYYIELKGNVTYIGKIAIVK